MAYVLERNRSAEMQLLTSPLGRYVASVIDRVDAEDVNGVSSESVFSSEAQTPVQRATGS
jgi:hypothetical protein